MKYSTSIQIVSACLCQIPFAVISDLYVHKRIFKGGIIKSRLISYSIEKREICQKPPVPFHPSYRRLRPQAPP